MPRRTISVSDHLDQVITAIAADRGTSYNAAVVSLLEAATSDRPLPYEGIGAGPGDLSIRAEAYLDELAFQDHRDDFGGGER